ncbi:MAG: tryptophan synthase subunit alpha [Bacteroidia bacterium]
MSKFNFRNKKSLSIYIPFGFPSIEGSIKLIKELNNNSKVDFIEIGFPYSDPLADGSVIQEASQIAIANGSNLTLLFSKLIKIKGKINKPIILMGYLNIVENFGSEKFYKKCRESGISAVIIPDLPLEIYLKKHKLYSQKHSINIIFIVTPSTNKKRVKKLAAYSKPFLYVTSSNMTTGNKLSNQANLEMFLKEINSIKTPKMVGFGIDSKNTLKNVWRIADGGIVGSNYIKSIQDGINTNTYLDNIIPN